MSGAGNLFTVIDNRKYNFTGDEGIFLAKILCNINEFNDYQCEGLMLVQPINGSCDFEVLYYNPDGTTGMMCGNGGRCAVNFAASLGFIDKKNDISFLMSGDIYSASITGEEVELVLPAPRNIQSNVSIDIHEMELTGDYIDVGSEHFVLNKDSSQHFKNISLNEVDIKELGKMVRFHKRFEPKGVNFNFYALEDNKIHLRTYERGVENETGACGTGAISTALSAYLNNRIKLPVVIIPTSGEKLEVDIKFDEQDEIMHFLMTGPAIFTSEKIIVIPETKIFD